MSTSTQTLPITMSDDATFRTYIQNFETALAACGLVQVPQTGEMNPTTVTKPTTTWTLPGFRIWRLNDAAQSTNPIFLRFDHGTANAITTPYTYLSIGTAVDGSGVLSNSVDVAAGWLKSHASGTTACLWSGDGSRFSVALYHCGSNQYENVFSLERVSNGIVTLDITLRLATYIKKPRFLPYTGLADYGTQANLYTGFTAPYGMTTGVVGNTTSAFTFRVYNPAECAAGSGILIGFPGDTILGNTYSFAVNGEAKSYLAIDLISLASFNLNRENTNCTRLLLRFE